MNEDMWTKDIDVVEVETLLEPEDELIALDNSSCKSSGH